MEYVIPLILVLVIVTAGIVAFVMNSQRRTSSRGDLTAADEDHSAGPGIGADATPLGDTAEHAGRQTEAGETVGHQDAVRYGGTGHPLDHYGATVPEERDGTDAGGRPIHPQAAPADPRRDDLVDGAEQAVRRPGDPPDSERLADRPA